MPIVDEIDLAEVILGPVRHKKKHIIPGDIVEIQGGTTTYIIQHSPPKILLNLITNDVNAMFLGMNCVSAKFVHAGTQKVDCRIVLFDNTICYTAEKVKLLRLGVMI